MEELIAILKELHPEVDFKSCTTLIDDKILDSFDLITIIAEVHDRMGVTLPAQELVAENFNSAENIFKLIQRLEEDED
jgi:acyl carrier protein